MAVAMAMAMAMVMAVAKTEFFIGNRCMKILPAALLGLTLSASAHAGCNNADFTGDVSSSRKAERQFNFSFRADGKWKGCSVSLYAFHQPWLGGQCTVRGAWVDVGDYIRVSGKDNKGRCIVITGSHFRPSSVRKARWDREAKTFKVWYKNGDLLKGTER